jgi:hypothetical protein
LPRCPDKVSILLPGVLCVASLTAMHKAPVEGATGSTGETSLSGGKQWEPSVLRWVDSPHCPAATVVPDASAKTYRGENGNFDHTDRGSRISKWCVR